MWVPRCIVAAISMLVLTATPAVVEGTCKCADMCPNYVDTHCWATQKHCGNVQCDGYCVCNMWGCNCDGCQDYPGACAMTNNCTCNTFGCYCDGCKNYPPYGCNALGCEAYPDAGCAYVPPIDDYFAVDMTKTQQTHELTDEEEEDGCADFRYITSLSREEKRDFLAEKYCSEDNKVAVQNIFEILRNEVLRKFGGSVLTCALFNESYVDVRHLKLCEDKQHLVVSLLTTSSLTGNTNGGHSFVLVVVGLLGAAMIAMKVVQRRHRVLLRLNQYSNPDDEL